MNHSSPLPSSLLCSSHPQLVKGLGNSMISKRPTAVFCAKKERSRGALSLPGAGWRQVINTKSASPRAGASRLSARQLVTVCDVFQGDE